MTEHFGMVRADDTDISWLSIIITMDDSDSALNSTTLLNLKLICMYKARLANDASPTLVNSDWDPLIHTFINPSFFAYLFSHAIFCTPFVAKVFFAYNCCVPFVAYLLLHTSFAGLGASCNAMPWPIERQKWITVRKTISKWNNIGFGFLWSNSSTHYVDKQK